MKTPETEQERRRRLSADLMEALILDEQKLEDDAFAREMGVDDDSYVGSAE